MKRKVAVELDKMMNSKTERDGTTEKQGLDQRYFRL